MNMLVNQQGFINDKAFLHQFSSDENLNTELYSKWLRRKKETKNLVAIATIPWICIREATGSNIDRGTDFSTEIFGCSHVSLQANAAQHIYYVPRVSFQILSTSVFINYLTIRSYVFLISDSQADNLSFRI